MNVTILPRSYEAIVNNPIFGYLGETNGRDFTISFPEVQGVTPPSEPGSNYAGTGYYLHINYGDNITYRTLITDCVLDTDIYSGKIHVNSNFLKNSGWLKCQWVAEIYENNAYNPVAKSSIFRLWIGESITDGPITNSYIDNAGTSEPVNTYNYDSQIAYLQSEINTLSATIDGIIMGDTSIGKWVSGPNIKQQISFPIDSRDYSSIITGNNVIASGYDMFVWGRNINTSNSQGITMGKNITFNNSGAIILGKDILYGNGILIGNNLSRSSGCIIGTDISELSSVSIGIGQYIQNIKGSGNILLGSNLTGPTSGSTGRNSVVIGNELKFQRNPVDSIIIGYNHIYSSYGFAPTNTIVLGKHNSFYSSEYLVNVNDSLIFGNEFHYHSYQGNDTLSNIISIGNGIRIEDDKTENIIILGKYNALPQTEDIFIIGDGDYNNGNELRENALTLKKVNDEYELYVGDKKVVLETPQEEEVE